MKLTNAFRQRLVTRWWQTRGAWSMLVRPAAWAYGAAVAVKLRGASQPERLPVPVIVVGNLVVGGAGKTPVVLALVQALERGGKRVGVLASGYGSAAGGRAALPVEVADDSSAAAVGDEPILLHQRTQAPVWVGRDRLAAARALIRAHPNVELIVCDDGLQHLALPRDLEVLVFGAGGVGNGLLLPAGPLREPWPGRFALSADGVAVPGEPTRLALYADTPPKLTPGLRAAAAQRSLAPQLVNELGHELDWEELAQKSRKTPVVALAGIAQPQAFFKAVVQHGVKLAAVVPLADHAALTQPLEQHLPRAHPARAVQTLWVCTEKDAVKLWPNHAKRPAWQGRIYAAPLEVELPTELLEAALKLRTKTKNR